MQNNNISQISPDPQITGAYVIPTLGLDESSLFSHLGSFLSFLTPHELPVGKMLCVLFNFIHEIFNVLFLFLNIDLLKDAFLSKVSIFQLILETLKVESGFIFLVVVFILVALIPFCITLGWLCSNSSCTHKDEFNETPVDTLMTIDESWEDEINCTKRGLSFLLQIIILFLM